MTTETILATCITGIFSVWVWNLKHQMRDGDGPLPVGPSPMPSHMDSHHSARLAPVHVAAPAETESTRPSKQHYRRGDGVQTFVIDESEASPVEGGIG
jgi:hypothetical protein